MENDIDHRNFTIETKDALEDIKASKTMEEHRHHVYIIKVVTPSILVIIFLIIILIIYIKFFGSKVERCSVVSSFSKTAAGEGKETWRRVKMMSHRQLPPIPEEKQQGTTTANSCQYNRSAPDQNERMSSNILDINDPSGQNTIFFDESADDSDYSEFTMNMGNNHLNGKTRRNPCGGCGAEHKERPRHSGDDGGHVYDEIFTQERLGRLSLDVARGPIPDLIPHYVNLPLHGQIDQNLDDRATQISRPPSPPTQSTSRPLISPEQLMPLDEGTLPQESRFQVAQRKLSRSTGTSHMKRVPSTHGSLRSSRSSSGRLRWSRSPAGSIRTSKSGKRSKRYADLHSVRRNHRINCSVPTSVAPILEQESIQVVDCKQELNESFTTNKDEEEYIDVVVKDDQEYNDVMQTLETPATVVKTSAHQPSDSTSENPRIKQKAFGGHLGVDRQDSFKLSHCQRVRGKQLFKKENQNKPESFAVAKIIMSEEFGESFTF